MPKLPKYRRKIIPEKPKFDPNRFFEMENQNHFQYAPYKLSIDDFKSLQEREQKFSLCKDAACKKVRKDLGHEINDFYTPNDFKIDDITKVKPFNHMNRPGTYQFISIPFEDSDIERLNQLEKHLVKTTETVKVEKREVFINTTFFYVAEEFGKPVAFTVMHQKQYSHLPSKKASLPEIEILKSQEPSDYSIAISLFIKGKTQYQIYRYDNNSERAPHHSRFYHGKVTNKKIEINGSHEHKYTQKFAVLFPFSSNHYEAEETQSRSFAEACDKIKDDFNLNNIRTLDPAQDIELNLEQIKYPFQNKFINSLGKCCEKC